MICKVISSRSSYGSTISSLNVKVYKRKLVRRNRRDFSGHPSSSSSEDSDQEDEFRLKTGENLHYLRERVDRVEFEYDSPSTCMTPISWPLRAFEWSRAPLG